MNDKQEVAFFSEKKLKIIKCRLKRNKIGNQKKPKGISFLYCVPQHSRSVLVLPSYTLESWKFTLGLFLHISQMSLFNLFYLSQFNL